MFGNVNTSIAMSTLEKVVEKEDDTLFCCTEVLCGRNIQDELHDPYMILTSMDSCTSVSY